MGVLRFCFDSGVRFGCNWCSLTGVTNSSIISATSTCMPGIRCPYVSNGLDGFA